jgi:UDP-glucose 4-epimerase
LAKQGVRIDWDGEQTRDYVYVKDVARANVLALDRGQAGKFCIGTNRRTSVNEIYRLLVQISGFEAPITRAPRRPGDARDAQFDPSLAKEQLGWQPSTQLADGMRETFEYFKNLLPA